MRTGMRRWCPRQAAEAYTAVICTPEILPGSRPSHRSEAAAVAGSQRDLRRLRHQRLLGQYVPARAFRDTCELSELGALKLVKSLLCVRCTTAHDFQ
jgi:hypothetical protein